MRFNTKQLNSFCSFEVLCCASETLHFYVMMEFETLKVTIAHLETGDKLIKSESLKIVESL